MSDVRSTIAALESERNRVLQNRERIAERVGRWLILAVPPLGVFGLFGHGLFSECVATSADGRVRVVYEAIERRSAPGALTVHVDPRPEDRDLRVSLSRDFANRTVLESAVPAPDSVEADNAQVTYLFRGSPRAPLELVYRFSHEELGIARFAIGTASGSSVSAQQWVLP